MTILAALSYISPMCGILGCIIGITMLYPWLREKFNSQRRLETALALEKNYDHINYRRVMVDTEKFLRRYKWDWRPRVVRKKRDLKHLRQSKQILVD